MADRIWPGIWYVGFQAYADDGFGNLVPCSALVAAWVATS